MKGIVMEVTYIVIHSGSLDLRPANPCDEWVGVYSDVNEALDHARSLAGGLFRASVAAVRIDDGSAKEIWSSYE